MTCTCDLRGPNMWKGCTCIAENPEKPWYIGQPVTWVYHSGGGIIDVDGYIIGFRKKGAPTQSEYCEGSDIAISSEGYGDAALPSELVRPRAPDPTNPWLTKAEVRSKGHPWGNMEQGWSDGATFSFRESLTLGYDDWDKGDGYGTGHECRGWRLVSK